jgi:hypothetical protein
MDVSVLLGDGTGGVRGAVNLPLGMSPMHLLITDLNADGKPDFALSAGGVPGAVITLINRGAAGPPIQTNHPLTAFGDWIGAGDFNGDGAIDLAAANDDELSNNNVNSAVALLLGDGRGGFQAPAYFPTDRRPQSLFVGDLDHDGNLDVVAANNYGNDLSVLGGNGNGTLKTAVNYPLSMALYLAGADFDLDGNLDIAASSNGHNVAVFLGKGNGMLQGGTMFQSGCCGSEAVAIGDFNGDGRPDLVVGATAGNATLVSVILNTSH